MTEEQLALSSVLEKQDVGEKGIGEKNTGKENTGKESRPVVIRVENSYKIYRVGDIEIRALDGLDFGIYKGEFAAVVEASGSGKSTLPNMPTGLKKSARGEVEVGRVHIEKMMECQLVSFRREKVRFVFQVYNLLNIMNILENVALPLSSRGVSRRQRLKGARKYMSLVGVGSQVRHMPNRMPGRQQQRVGIARALMVNPQIIFADKPTGSLDSKTTMEVPHLMQKIARERNQTLVMVTRDNNLASYVDRRVRIMGDRIVGTETGGREVLYERNAEKKECSENESR